MVRETIHYCNISYWGWTQALQHWLLVMLCTRFGFLFANLWHWITLSPHHAAVSPPLIALELNAGTAAFVPVTVAFHGNLCLGKRDSILLFFSQNHRITGVWGDLSRLSAQRKSCSKDKTRLLKYLTSVACLFCHWYYWRTGAFGDFLKLLLPAGTGQPVLKEAGTW